MFCFSHFHFTLKEKYEWEKCSIKIKWDCLTFSSFTHWVYILLHHHHHGVHCWWWLICAAWYVLVFWLVIIIRGKKDKKSVYILEKSFSLCFMYDKRKMMEKRVCGVQLREIFLICMYSQRHKHECYSHEKWRAFYPWIRHDELRIKIDLSGTELLGNSNSMHVSFVCFQA